MVRSKGEKSQSNKDDKDPVDEPSAGDLPEISTFDVSTADGYIVDISKSLLVLVSTLIGLISLVAALVFWKGYGGSVPLFVFTCGIIGGVISIQQRLPKLDARTLKMMSHSNYYLVLAPLVGGVLSLLLYMLFLSGLLSGDLFPNFVPDTVMRVVPGSDPQVMERVIVGEPGIGRIFTQGGEGYQDYGKLFFWSFVAGYSEKFIPNVIGRFEGAATASAPAKPAKPE